MNHVVFVVALALVGCAGASKQATIGGNDLYARAAQLREQGHVMMPTSAKTQIDLRLDQYLVDRSRDQVFHVREIVDGCFGNSMSEDTECTVALMRDQRFVVSDAIPAQKRLPDEEGGDMQPINKARLVLLTAGTAMAVGAAKCNAFEGCKDLLGIGAGLDALLLLVTYTGMH